MAFNTWLFVAFFLPLTLLGFGLLSRREKPMWVKLWLIAASLVFYGWMDPPAIGVLFGSVIFNFALGRQLRRQRESCPISRKALLTVGITINLALLGYAKYRNFFLDNLGLASDPFDQLLSWVVPLGLSFLTFQQIAYLVDVYRDVPEPESLLDYSLFMTFFPKLLAGPIIRRGEFIPQLGLPSFGTISAFSLAEGITLFVIGLAKKVVLADSLGPFVDSIFDDALAGTAISCWQAWGGMLAYTFQLYFDFSGYTDMAIGIALMFGLCLPANFNLPYTASSIREFWRRWHMTFSRFLRDYLYIPMGGSRLGPGRTAVNLLLTMLLGGLWHGAGWTFLVWGALHGFYLVINHAWGRLGFHLPRFPAWLLTFLGVSYSWLWFRADSVAAAGRMSHALLDPSNPFPNGLVQFLSGLQPSTEYANDAALSHVLGFSMTLAGTEVYPWNIMLSEPVLMSAWLAFAGLIAFWLPNPVERSAPDIRPTSAPLGFRGAFVVGILAYLVLVCSISADRAGFVYSQF